MIQFVTSESGLTLFAVVGLLIFFTVFVGIAAWVLTRKRGQVDTWASLPLREGAEPVEARGEQDGGNR